MIERTGPGTEACTVFQQDLPVGLGSGGSSSGPTLGSEPPVPEGGGSSDSSGAAGTTAAADSATDDAASATAATAFAAAATMQPSLLAADSLATSPVTLDALAVAMRAMSGAPLQWSLAGLDSASSPAAASADDATTGARPCADPRDDRHCRRLLRRPGSGLPDRLAGGSRSSAGLDLRLFHHLLFHSSPPCSNLSGQDVLNRRRPSAFRRTGPIEQEPST